MSLTNKFDLHCHSTCSDGTLTPEEIVRHAKTIGLAGLSITDHDTIEAYKTAYPLAKELGLRMISGVEFSTFHQKTSLHILAYSFPLNSSIIQEFCKEHAERRTHRNSEILAKLAKHGMPISEEEIFKEDTVGRPHIALAMVKHGYVSTVKEAFKLYIGEDKPCYAPGKIFSTAETVDLIHQAGGLAVIAHPELIDNLNVVPDLMKMPFDGIECYYARFHESQLQRWFKVAQKKNWLITGGSDFHGTIKENIPLGCSWVDDEKFTPLEQHFLLQN